MKLESKAKLLYDHHEGVEALGGVVLGYGPNDGTVIIGYREGDETPNGEELLPLDGDYIFPMVFKLDAAEGLIGYLWHDVHSAIESIKEGGQL